MFRREPTQIQCTIHCYLPVSAHKEKLRIFEQITGHNTMPEQPTSNPILDQRTRYQQDSGLYQKSASEVRESREVRKI